MLVALSSSGRRQVASSAARLEEFHCPACAAPLVVRMPATRVPHFAHLPGSKCSAKLSKAVRQADARRQAALARLRRRDQEAEDAGQGSLFDLAPPAE